MVPRTLTRPRVPKNLAESGMTTYVQPPLAGDFCNLAVNCFFTIPPSFTARTVYIVGTVPARDGLSKTVHWVQDFSRLDPARAAAHQQPESRTARRQIGRAH